MIISIGEKTQEYMNILNISSYPFSEKELKSNFRVLIKANHSDVSDDPKAKEKSQKIILAYNALKNLALFCEGASPIKNYEKTDIFDLSEECLNCSSSGIVSYETSSPCPDCSDINRIYYFLRKSSFGKGFYYVTCPKCTNGEFTLKSGRKVSCKNCNGYGKIKKRCDACKGTGILKRTYENTCPECSGIGRKEVKVYNPVIPKGATLI